MAAIDKNFYFLISMILMNLSAFIDDKVNVHFEFIFLIQGKSKSFPTLLDQKVCNFKSRRNENEFLKTIVIKFEKEKRLKSGRCNHWAVTMKL